jgi:hypothetical protein
MKALLITTAALETGAGLGLLLAPSAVATALLGAPLESPAAQAVARIAGAALLALGVACWVARHHAGSGAARGIITGMLLYNGGAAAVLVQGAMGAGLRAVGLWPTAILHTAVAAWCLACLLPRHNRPPDSVTPERQTALQGLPRLEQP